MPIATPDQYAAILQQAKTRQYALPAINVTSSQTLNAALEGLSRAHSDGILQITTGGADYFSGHTVKNRAVGAIAFARLARELAAQYPVTVALHTDHCPKDALDSFLLPVLEASEREVAAGNPALFQSHMWDGSSVPLEENITIAQALLPRTAAIDAVLEIEIGTVGKEDDAKSGTNAALYTTTDDVTEVVEQLGLGERGRYLTALTFGNVHGVFKDSRAKLRPELLGEIQEAIQTRFKTPGRPLDLVFHGGSGSDPDAVAEAIANGVVKMNVDTDTQYAFARSVADSVFRQYDGFLKVDGDVGSKKVYDPRVWGAAAETSMAERVAEIAAQLGSAGNAM